MLILCHKKLQQSLNMAIIQARVTYIPTRVCLTQFLFSYMPCLASTKITRHPKNVKKKHIHERMSTYNYMKKYDIDVKIYQTTNLK